MSRVPALSARVLFLLLAAMMATVHFADRASSADVRIAIAGPSGPLYAAPDAARPHMTPLPRLAQGRCPGGQLVFLSRACGCNGACCLCSRQSPLSQSLHMPVRGKSEPLCQRPQRGKSVSGPRAG